LKLLPAHGGILPLCWQFLILWTKWKGICEHMTRTTVKYLSISKDHESRIILCSMGRTLDIEMILEDTSRCYISFGLHIGTNPTLGIERCDQWKGNMLLRSHFPFAALVTASRFHGRIFLVSLGLVFAGTTAINTNPKDKSPRKY